MRNAVFVSGAESSGNRLITRILADNGFTDVSGTETGYRSTKRWQDVRTPETNEPIVWLRSIPHGGEWPDFWGMTKLLRLRDYRVTALVPMRDWWSTANSQVQATHVGSTAEALKNLRVAAATVFGTLAALEIPFAVVSYEQLVRSPPATLSNALRANSVATPPLIVREEIRDENAKWEV